MSQIGPEHASRVCGPAPPPLASPHLVEAADARVLGSTLVDALVAAAWCALALDTWRQGRREREARKALGPVVAGGWQPPGALRALVLAATLGAAALLEHVTGRLPHRPALAAAGLALVATGLALHAAARRALGVLWSAVVTVRARHVVVEHGPYAVVRHPLYAALLLLAGGSFLAHPSLATGCLAGGLAAGLLLKMRREERCLRQTLGPAYVHYAARVPALVPRLRSLTGRRR